MATASLPQQRSVRARQRHRPSDDRIFQLVEYEVRERGARGAPNRVAALLHLSDDTVRRAYKRVDDRKRTKESKKCQEIEYVPPPGAYSTWLPGVSVVSATLTSSTNVASSAQANENDAEIFMSSDEQPEAINDALLAVLVLETPQVDDAECRTGEREFVGEVAGNDAAEQCTIEVEALPAYDPLTNRPCPVPGLTFEQVVGRIAFGLTIGTLVAAPVMATKSTAVALLLVVSFLGFGWFSLEARRLQRGNAG